MGDMAGEVNRGQMVKQTKGAGGGGWMQEVPGKYKEQGLGTEWTSGQMKSSEPAQVGGAVYLEKLSQRHSEQVCRGKAQGVQLGHAEFEIPMRNPNGAPEKQLAVWVWGSKMISGLEK